MFENLIITFADRSPGARTEVTSMRNGKTLTINDLDRDEDTKVITCKVFNMYKTLYANGPLIVLSKYNG